MQMVVTIVGIISLIVLIYLGYILLKGDDQA